MNKESPEVLLSDYEVGSKPEKEEAPSPVTIDLDQFLTFLSNYFVLGLSEEDKQKFTSQFKANTLWVLKLIGFDTALAEYIETGKGFQLSPSWRLLIGGGFITLNVLLMRLGLRKKQE